MVYFTRDTFFFLQKLEQNNNTTWFNTNKLLFEKKVKTPFQNFIEDLSKELERMEGSPIALPKDCIFRITRDVRFSEDKSPYKTFVSALISPFGKKNKAYPGLYIQISAREVRLYSGSHDLSSDQLTSVRQKIADEPERFKQIISKREFVSVFGEVRGEKNKKIPDPFLELMDVIPLVANKEFYYFTVMTPEMISKANFAKVILEKYAACREINMFLKEALTEIDSV